MRVTVPFVTTALAGVATVVLCTWVGRPPGSSWRPCSLVAALTSCWRGGWSRAIDGPRWWPRATRSPASPSSSPASARPAGVGAAGEALGGSRRPAPGGAGHPAAGRGRALATGALPLATAVATVGWPSWRSRTGPQRPGVGPARAHPVRPRRGVRPPARGGPRVGPGRGGRPPPRPTLLDERPAVAAPGRARLHRARGPPRRADRARPCRTCGCAGSAPRGTGDAPPSPRRPRRRARPGGRGHRAERLRQVDAARRPRPPARPGGGSYLVDGADALAPAPRAGPRPLRRRRRRAPRVRDDAAGEPAWLARPDRRRRRASST